MEFRVASDTDMAELTAVIERVMQEMSPEDTGKTKVSIDGFGSNGYSVSFPLYAGTLSDYTEKKTELIPKLYAACKEKGITVL